LDNKKSILIADDVEVNRAILREMFQDKYTICEARDGKEAIEVLKRDSSIVIVLLDIMMPVADGFFVLEQMKDLNFIKHIPVIFITGSDSIEFEQRGLDLGVTEVVSKPFNPVIVTKRVENTIALYEVKNNIEAQARKLLEKLQKTNDVMIDGFSGLVESRNRESGAHMFITLSMILKFFLTNMPLVKKENLHRISKR
jgi:putative two-component system response regulator